MVHGTETVVAFGIAHGFVGFLGLRRAHCLIRLMVTHVVTHIALRGQPTFPRFILLEIAHV